MRRFVFAALCCLVLLAMCLYAYRNDAVLQETFRSFTVRLIEDDDRLLVSRELDDYDERLGDLVAKYATKFGFAPPSVSKYRYDDTLGFQLDAADTKSLVAVTDDKKHACFIKNVSPKNDQSLSTLMDTPTYKIAYRNDKDRVVIESLLFCLGKKFVPENYVRYATWNDAARDLFDAQTIDGVFVFANLRTPSFKDAFSNEKLGLYHYDGVDVGKVRVVLPHATLIDYDFSDDFYGYFDKTTVRKTLRFDNVVYTTGATGKRTSSYLLDYVIRLFAKNYFYLNYYGQFFAVHPRTIALLERSNAETEREPDYGILETFRDATPVTFKPTGNVRGYSDDAAGTLEIDGVYMEGARMQADDVVVLEHQTRKQENGIYLVRSSGESADKGNDTSTNSADNGTTILRLVSVRTVPKPDAEERLDPLYLCTNRSIKIKELCESAYDTTGTLKPGGVGDVWDKPCVSDGDCPFYQKNTTYKNYRGGCLNGYCEMPVGIERVAFRHYTGTPVCRSCADPLDEGCCAKQTNPDYAFPLDDYERLPKLVVESFDQSVVEDPKKAALVGDYEANVGDAAPNNAFYSEVTNEDFQKMLSTLVNRTFLVEPSVFQLRQVIADAVQTVMTEHGEQGYDIYDIAVGMQTTNNQDDLDTYVVFVTIYKLAKSHGKRVRIVIEYDSVRQMCTVTDVVVTGIVVEENVGTLKDVPLGVVEHSGHAFEKKCFRPITSDPVFTESNTQRFMCDRARKLKQDFNLETDPDPDGPECVFAS